MLRSIVGTVGVLAVVLWTSLAQSAPCAGFVDVDDTSPFCVNVEWMKNRGITLGLTATLYDPNSPVTRLQMAAFMYRLGFQNAFLQGGNAFGATAVLGTTDTRPVEIWAGNGRVMRYEPLSSPNLIGGYVGNFVGGIYQGQTVGGGGRLGSNCFEPTTLTNIRLCANGAASYMATVGGGFSNFATGQRATIAGGNSNSAIGDGATIAGGFGNSVSGLNANVAGGSGNSAEGIEAMIPGGVANHADGDYSFAAGRRARALEQGMFVWADATDRDFAPTSYRPANTSYNTFNVRATGPGGVWFVTAINAVGAPTWGCYAQDGTGWTCTSDRNVKRNLELLDGVDVLDKVAAMPIYRWQPKDGPNAAILHAGPMAQDFHAAFGFGDSDKSIGLQDADGVALAAIQGLNAKMESRLSAKDAEIAALRAELADLRSLKAEVASIRAAQSRENFAGR